MQTWQRKISCLEEQNSSSNSINGESWNKRGENIDCTQNEASNQCSVATKPNRTEQNRSKKCNHVHSRLLFKRGNCYGQHEVGPVTLLHDQLVGILIGCFYSFVMGNSLVQLDSVSESIPRTLCNDRRASFTFPRWIRLLGVSGMKNAPIVMMRPLAPKAMRQL